jgi:hypothetical protein
MSGQIKLKAATLGGDITLSPTDTASNLVVTIPAVTATLLNNLSDIEDQSKTALNATGSAPIYACRAWVKFDGFTGAVAILASGNVSSITDVGVGKYTVNFTTAMEDANYSVTGIAAYSGGGFNDPMAIGQDNTTSSSASSYPFYTYRIGVGLADSLPCCLAIFR